MDCVLCVCVVLHQPKKDSKLGLLQESFAIETWKNINNGFQQSFEISKINDPYSYPLTNINNLTQFQPLKPMRTFIDFDLEMSHLSIREFVFHIEKIMFRKLILILFLFFLRCFFSFFSAITMNWGVFNFVRITAKYMLLHSLDQIFFEINFFGETFVSPVCAAKQTDAINPKETLAPQDKEHTLHISPIQTFTLKITPDKLVCII